ncbi:GPW/gp25 family protein [Telmatobacter bradus]|uniref:GPW/gp25 family protein n=1 Tax=Telmatobacter bradus TaxID=474953 RepID=UPI003B43488C
MRDRSFLGTGWGFPLEFGTYGKRVRMASADEDIRESLRILLSTAPGERVMNPSFGCGLRTRVFSSISEGMLTEVKDLVERAILFFEPRITLNGIQVVVRDRAEGIVDIDIRYTVRSTNSRSNMVYPFYFREASNADLALPLPSDMP